MVSKASLLATAEKLSEEADAEELKTFDTTASKLGELLMVQKVKVEDLMVEWDRNKDGDISKQE